MSASGELLRFGRRSSILGAGSLLASPSILRAQTAGGVALVIGNSKYHWEAPLPNVRRDAPDVARAFQSYGLKTELVQDAGLSAMNQALEHFAAAAKGAQFAAFYFAGHGASWGADSYLVPADAELGNPDAVKNLIKTRTAGRTMSEAVNRLLVFDNCRNNPADGWRQLESERNAVTSPEQQRQGAAGSANTLTLFSTAPGRIARDGPAGDNSPFAACFLRQLQPASIDLQSTPSKLRRDLLIATEGRQLLWDSNRFQQPFVLNAPRNRQPVAVGGAAGGASGGAASSGRIVELTRAYAYAQENGLPLPSGLVACRPPGSGSGDSRDAWKVGSFQFINRNDLGESPALLIVLSVEGQQTAEIITSIKGRFNPQTQKLESGSIWRFVTSRISGDKLNYVPRAGSASWVFDWRDANSGSFSLINDQQVGRTAMGFSSRFTRLDG